MIDFSFINKGKGHLEAINTFFDRVKNNQITTSEEIDSMCFSTFTATKLQSMVKGDILNILDCYELEVSLQNR
jgi:hypothetical protein